MIKKLNTYPEDEMVLRQPARRCISYKAKEVDMDLQELVPGAAKPQWDKEVIDNVQDLLDTAESLGDTAVGLSSCQIWDNPERPPLAIFVIKVSDGKTSHWQEFINPMVGTSGATVKIKESCLSVPNYSKVKKREANVSIAYQTLMEHEPVEMKLYGKVNMLPIVIQHEYDHLYGKLI